MTTYPILFSGPMVRALLDGRKMQTRRTIKDRGALPQYCGGRHDSRDAPENWGFEWHDHGSWITLDQWRKWRFVPFAVGDRLWVREAWSGEWSFRDTKPSERVDFVGDGVPYLRENIWYWADGNPEFGDWERPRPSTHMPRWASRLTLTVTDVRVQRLQDISEADAIAEGCSPFFDESDPQIYTGPNGTEHEMMPLKGPIDDFHRIWTSLHGPEAWSANPWVAAYTFTVHRCNIDQMGDAQ